MEEIHATIDVQKNASIVLEYRLWNTGKGAASVSLALQQYPATLLVDSVPLRGPLTLQAGERRVVTAALSVPVPASSPVVFTLDPTLLFDGKPNAARLERTMCALTLPKGVPSLIAANWQGGASSTNGEGRVTYTWSAGSSYPSPLSVKWNPEGIALSLVKTVEPPVIQQANQTLTVRVEVRNTGTRPLSGLVLLDTYETGSFEPVEPANEFSSVVSNQTEPRILWRKEIGAIAPGESRLFAHRVKYTGTTSVIQVFSLDPTGAYASGALVGSSEPVTIQLMAGAVPVTTAPTSTTASPGPLLAFSALIAVFLLMHPKR
ncbi:MAG: hypothetical protein QHG99_00035 [Methanomicrobiales archaeon]|nr:hypothetical protein [Methanomicrobiales archaeon]